MIIFTLRRLLLLLVTDLRRLQPELFYAARAVAGRVVMERVDLLV